MSQCERVYWANKQTQHFCSKSAGHLGDHCFCDGENGTFTKSNQIVDENNFWVAQVHGLTADLSTAQRKLAEQTSGFNMLANALDALFGLDTVNSCEDVEEAIAAFEGRYVELEEELAEEREKYENRSPTEWAYNQACTALEKHKALAAKYREAMLTALPYTDEEAFDIIERALKEGEQP